MDIFKEYISIERTCHIMWQVLFIEGFVMKMCIIMEYNKNCYEV